MVLFTQHTRFFTLRNYFKIQLNIRCSINFETFQGNPKLFSAPYHAGHCCTNVIHGQFCNLVKFHTAIRGRCYILAQFLFWCNTRLLLLKNVFQQSFQRLPFFPNGEIWSCRLPTPQEKRVKHGWSHMAFSAHAGAWGKSKNLLELT